MQQLIPRASGQVTRFSVSHLCTVAYSVYPINLGHRRIDNDDKGASLVATAPSTA